MKKIRKSLSAKLNTETLLKIGSISIVLLLFLVCILIDLKEDTHKTRESSVGDKVNCDGLIIEGGIEDIDFSYAGPSDGVYIKTDKPLRIYNKYINNEVYFSIIVKENVSANITLAGVNINASHDWGIYIDNGSTEDVTTTVTLEKGTTNTLRAEGYGGITKCKNDSGKLVIRCSEEGEGHVCNEDCGILNAIGSWGGAGIGSYCSWSEEYTYDGSDIEITGGNIFATGGKGGAGIGSGTDPDKTELCGTAHDITISGGNITATGGEGAAGIGGGYKGAASNIRITGGVVTAIGGTRTDAHGGAGIGGGMGGDASNIVITGGDITTTGGLHAPGIGSGFGGDVSGITIDGGTINSTGSTMSSSIGGACNGTATDITINGGNICAISGSMGSGIGSGCGGATGSGIKINGGEIVARGLEYYAIYGTYEVGGNVVLVEASDQAQNIDEYTDEHMIESPSINSLDRYMYIKLSEKSMPFKVIGGTEGLDYTYDGTDNVLTINTDEELTISNTDINTATTARIVVASGVSPEITLAGVNIDVSAISSATAFKIEDNSEGNVTLILASGDNTKNILKSGEACAGIQKNGTYISEDKGKLIIQCEHVGVNHTCNSACGKLEVYGELRGAGIGGTKNKTASNIEIKGGNITAKGGMYSAGIGGGDIGTGDRIIISGGNITSTGGQFGAGIGGGETRKGINITISGGKVTAKGGSGAKGIGNGNKNSGGDNDIKIEDGWVVSSSMSEYTATGGVLTITTNNKTTMYSDYTVKSNVEVPSNCILITDYMLNIAEDSTLTNNGLIVIKEDIGNIQLIDNNQGGIFLYYNEDNELDVSKGNINIGTTKYTYNSVNYILFSYTGNGETYDYLNIDNHEIKTKGTTTEYEYKIGEYAKAIYADNVVAKKVTIDGGSVKGTIGDANNKVYNSKNAELHQEIIPNPDNVGIYIDGALYSPRRHSDEDTNLYVWIPSTSLIKPIEQELDILDGEEGTEYTFSYTTGVYTINDGAELTIKNKENIEQSINAIKIGENANVLLKLDCVNIKTTDKSPIEIVGNSQGNVTLVIANNSVNNLVSNAEKYAGISKGSNSSNTVGKLTIRCEECTDSRHICDEDRCGKLNATGGDEAAGIGGRSGSSTYGWGRNIEINGGIINAQGGKYGAGIGGAYKYGSKNITITGGIVTTKGGASGGAGIGGGYNKGNAYDITLTGGIIKATGVGGGAGIGGGKQAELFGKVTIENSNVVIDGGSASGIGHGTSSSGESGELVVKDAQITSKGSIGAINVSTVTISSESDESSTQMIEASDSILNEYTDADLIRFPSSNSTSYKYVKIGPVASYYYSYDVNNNYIEKVLSSGERSTVDLSEVITIEDNGASGKKMILDGFKHTTVNKYALYIEGDIDIVLKEESENVIENVYTQSDTCSSIGALYVNGNINRLYGKGKLKAYSKIHDIDGDATEEGDSHGLYATGGIVVGRIDAILESHGANSSAIYTENSDKCSIKALTYGSTEEKTGDVEIGNLDKITDINIEFNTYKYVIITNDRVKITEGPFDITGGDLDFNYIYNDTDEILTILSGSEDLIIANTNPQEATTARIVVAKDISVNITLAGVYIDVSSVDEYAAFEIEDDSQGNVVITLAEGTENILKSGEDCAGLQKNGVYIDEDKGKLVITCEKENESHKCNEGCGKLNAVGKETGIGGGYYASGSNIEINGGDIIAKGGTNGAGIGGGERRSGDYITINGGYINAKGGYLGAGIGGGYSNGGYYITINGGYIIAEGNVSTTTYGKSSAAIGGGTFGGARITINGGEITATTTEDAAAIGAGSDTTSCNITINGGKINAINTDGVGIGRGYKADNSDIENAIINIESLEYIVAKGSERAIYGTLNMDEYKHSIVEACVTSCSGDSIGRGVLEELSNYMYVKITPNIESIEGNVVGDFKITDGEYGRDYIYNNDSKMLTVLKDGANLTIENANKVDGVAIPTDNRIAVDGDISATIILNGVNISCSTTYHSGIEIQKNSTKDVKIILAEESENELKGGEYGAGLQRIIDSYTQTEGNLIITCEHGDEDGHVCGYLCGKLKANGGNYGAGIGGGAYGSMGTRYYGAGRNIEIMGGKIEATGNRGAGIGGGYHADGSNITIKKGIIKAEGSGITNFVGAGIGGGAYGAGKDILINGGTITATTRAEAAAIGAGSESAICSITIKGGTITASNTETYGVGIGRGYIYGDEDVSRASINIESTDGLTISAGNKAIFGTVIADEDKLAIEEASFNMSGVSLEELPTWDKTNEYKYVKIVLVNYNVIITWGALDYTLTAGEWDPQNRKYKKGIWTVNDDDGDRLIIKNDGNVAVKISVLCNIDEQYGDVTGAVLTNKNDGTTIVTELQDVLRKQSIVNYIALDGDLPRNFGTEGKVIGNVTVRLN